nr:hypothetical protein [Tanacetum cinerariifolium]
MQMAFGKDTSNPFMADNLPKIVWFSTHHVTFMKSWLVQKQTVLGKDSSNPLIVDSLLKTIWFSIHHHLTNEVLAIQGQTATGVNTPRSDEDRLKLMELIVFLLQKDETVAEDVANEAIPSTHTPLILPSPTSHDIPSTSQSSPQALPQGAEFLTHLFQQVLDTCSALTRRVENLEHDKAAQKLEIIKLKAMVKSTASATISAAKPSIPAAAPIVVVAYTRRRKGVIIRDPEEELSSKTLVETPKLKEKGKGMSYDKIRPIFQARFDANMRFFFKSREEMEEEDREVLKSINETPVQKAAKRRKLNKEAQEVEDLKKHLEVVNDEDDDVFTEATPLKRKVPVVDYQIVLIHNKP